MDVFCLPSLFEGLSITCIEAQAAGLKCLLADVISEDSGITDLVTFLPLEEQIWMEEIALTKMSEDRKQRGREIKEAGYDIRTAVKKLEKLYE